MKIPIIALLLVATSPLVAEPMYLPVEATTLSTAPIGTAPKCSVDLKLDEELKLISEATLLVGEDKFVIPPKALTKVLHPDLATVRIETEKGTDGKMWYSIVLRPSRHTENPTTYHISVIDGKFAQVSKSWDEPQENSIRRHFEILHKEK
jgi:hypothetical protein